MTLGCGFLDARTARGDPTLTHGYAITGHAAQGITVFMSGRVGILAWFLAHRERFAHGLR